MNLKRACDPGGKRNAQGNLCFHKESGYDAVRLKLLSLVELIKILYLLGLLVK